MQTRQQILFERLTPRCQSLATKIERLLSQNDEKHMLHICLPEGIEKDNFLAYVASMTVSNNQRVAYVAATDQNVVHAALNLTKGYK